MSDFENVSISDNDSFVDIRDSFIIQEPFINVQESDTKESDTKESDTEDSDIKDLDVQESINIFDPNILKGISNNFSIDFPKDIKTFNTFDSCMLETIMTDQITKLESEKSNKSIYLDTEEDVKPCEQLILSKADFSLFTDFGTKVINSCEAIIRSSEEYLSEILGDDDSEYSSDFDINIPPESKQKSDSDDNAQELKQDNAQSEQDSDSDLIAINITSEYDEIDSLSEYNQADQDDSLSEHEIIVHQDDSLSEHDQIDQDDNINDTSDIEINDTSDIEINDTSDIELNEIKFQNLSRNDKIYKQLKILCRNNTGEQLRLFGNDLIIYTKMGTKIIGMCAVAMKSPNDHFDNEIYDDIPYLYNYICDKSKKKKQSLLIMNYIKNWAINNKKKYINLDVLMDNKHAQNFFEKNNFTSCGIYRNVKYEYIMYTCILTPLGR
jgi:hypothetical protein